MTILYDILNAIHRKYHLTKDFAIRIPPNQAHELFAHPEANLYVELHAEGHPATWHHKLRKVPLIIDRDVATWGIVDVPREGEGTMKTIDDLYRLTLTDPVVRGFMRMVDMQEMTLEQALIEMVFALSQQRDAMRNNYLAHLHTCPGPICNLEPERGGLVRPAGGDYPLKWMSKGAVDR